MELSANSFYPFVRCVGIGRNCAQSVMHQSYDCRLIGILDGSGKVVIEDKEYLSQVGDVYIIPPGTKYRVFSISNQKICVVNFDCTYEHCHIKDPVLSVYETRFVSENIIDKRDWSAIFGTPGAVALSVSDHVLQKLEELWLIYIDQMEEKHKYMQLSGILLQIIGKVMLEKYNPDGRSKTTADRIWEYMKSHCREPVTLEGVSEIFNLHPTYINRILSQRYRTSFRQGLIQFRLNQAMMMLENTDLSIEEIATTVGFYNSNHFSATFRKRYAITPSKYRK